MKENLKLTLNSEMDNIETVTFAGSRNEIGFINGLNRQGFTPTKCIAELIANFIDAFAKNATFAIVGEYIKLIDDGIGMTRDKLINMFDANRENHANEKSMGVSGIGGIISNFQLSKTDDGNPNEVTLFTKHKNGVYLKVVVPWDVMYEQKKYDEQMKIYSMNETEKHDFITERKGDANLTGTTIRFPYSENFRMLLEEHFISKQMDGYSLNTWLPVIFGKTNSNIILDKCNGLSPIELSKYNYFGGNDTEFYCGKFRCEIYYLHENGKDRFICLNPNNKKQYVEIVQTGTGFSTVPKPINIDPRLIENSQIIQFTSGIRKDNRMFDCENPEEPSATFCLNPYDSEYMTEQGQKDAVKEFCSKTSVYRNNQRITGYGIEGFNFTNARANGGAMIENVLHRTEISYETASTQENRIDNVHGIQQNKNQNQNELPKQYNRLLKFLKEYDCQRNIQYFNKVIAAHNEKKTNEQRTADEEKKKQMIEEKKHKRMATEEKKNKKQIAAEQKQPVSNACHNSITSNNDVQSECKSVLEQFESSIKSSVEERQTPVEDNAKTIEKNNCKTSCLKDVQSDPVILETTQTDLVAETCTKISHPIDNNLCALISESHNWQKLAAGALLKHAETAAYGKTNGKEIYDAVIHYLSNT